MAPSRPFPNGDDSVKFFAGAANQITDSVGIDPGSTASNGIALKSNNANRNGLQVIGILVIIFVNYFPALQPPSIISALPVTIALSSAARYSAAAATSSGFAILPLSWVDAMSR